MAEIAGLVIGVIGVAGVIGAFKDTIDLFNDFVSSREFGRDYEILDTKVDIERAILLQWAENVRLLQPDYDKRLDDNVTQRAVGGILGCIKFLMGDEAQLRNRYGLKTKEGQRADEGTSTVISGPRMAKFIKEFEAMKLRSKMRDRTTTFGNKIRWVIRDKDKFEELVKELAYFTTKLMQIVPAFASQETAQCAPDLDVTAVNGLRELKLIFDASVGRRLLIAESTREQIIRICQEKILRRLWFRTIDLRKESVSPAHSKTFSWALEPPEQAIPWDDLSKWLLYDSGIYWVTGKAGSGKSTLMKYLFQHDKTAALLSQWTGNIRCNMHHFFFWNLGTYEQKSQEGLSRALLYHILTSHPSLIQDVLPSMWKELYNNDGEVALPSAPEIRYAFQILATKASQIGKFCFFIDGLDEFVGSYRDGIAFIKELAMNSHIKIIVSSRPIPDCVASFNGLPSLELHHLTRADIETYVKDVVGKHKYMENLITRHQKESKRIMEYLVTKSSGVFLWVILACRSLLSGFADYDKIHELQRRVDELPPELEDMFQLMLNKIHKRHREQGSRMLRMCYANTKARDGREVGSLSSLGLALMDDDYTSVEKITTLTANQKHRLCEELEGRLRSRTGGLLETHWNVGSGHTESFFPSTKNGRQHRNETVDAGVEFMHRTVFEFLSNEQVWDFECLRPPNGIQIATDLSLICLYSATASRAVDHRQTVGSLRDGFRWGVQADLEDRNGRENIFYALERFLDYLALQYHSPSETGMLSRIEDVIRRKKNAPTIRHVVLLLAAEAGAVNFVRENLMQHDSSPMLDLHIISELLFHSVSFYLIGCNEPRENDRFGIASKGMTSLLLECGANPNHKVHEAHSATPWSFWLDSTYVKNVNYRDRLLMAEIAETFVQHGARLSDDFCRWVRFQLPKIPSCPGQNAITRLHDIVSKFERENELEYSLNSLPDGQLDDGERRPDQGSHFDGSASELTVYLRSMEQPYSVCDLKRNGDDEMSLDGDFKRVRVERF